MAVGVKSRSKRWKRLRWSVTQMTRLLSIGPLQIWERMEMQRVSSSTTQKGSCWTRRIRIGKAPEERNASPSRVPALEASTQLTQTARKIVARREYVARHVKKDSMDKWCKNEFVVQVSEVAGEFKCECKMFEHFGMVCSHSLKVMVWLGLQEVPAEHVLKRWTRDARDILPLEFLRYQKDQGPLKYSLRRHNNLHLLCLEIFRLGDSNVDAYIVLPWSN